MTPAVGVALKEWAAVCEALSAGRQTILLRKGGIAERPGGFRPEHERFWLLPTFFHERPESLKPEDRPFFDSAVAPPADRVRIALLARVAEVIRLDDEALLDRLSDEHVYGRQVVSERFHYRRPGLWLLVVEVFRAAAVAELAVWPELAGCHSWVDLPAALPADDLTPVLDAATFALRLARLRDALSATVSVPAHSSSQPPNGSDLTATEPAALDVAAMFELFGGDEALVQRLIGIYRQDRFPWMSRALAALGERDAAGLVFAAHRLHGMLSHFLGAPSVETSRRLEELARQADFAGAQVAYGQLERELAALDADLAAWQAGR